MTGHPPNHVKNIQINTNIKKKTLCNGLKLKLLILLNHTKKGKNKNITIDVNINTTPNNLFGTDLKIA